MSVRHNNRDSRRPSDWTEMAECDLRAAELLSSDEDARIFSFFHCHQAIEKTLKAYFLGADGFAPDGHNLVYFCRRATEKIPALRDYIGLCADINSYYIQARYPSDFTDEIDYEELPDILSGTRALFTLVTRKLNEINKKNKK